MDGLKNGNSVGIENQSIEFSSRWQSSEKTVNRPVLSNNSALGISDGSTGSLIIAGSRGSTEWDVSDVDSWIVDCLNIDS